METPSEKLHHEGVGLRRWREDDLDAIVRAVTESLDHLTPWMPWANGYTRESTTAFLRDSDEHWADGSSFNYAILADDGVIVGSCSLMARIGAGGLEIGYWLHADHTGRGLVTRAVAALVEEGFRIGAERLEIIHDAANTASGAVPRRLGFTEVERRSPPRQPVTSGEVGVDVVWRLTR